LIPNEITAQDVHAAIAEIDGAGVPSRRQSTRYNAIYKGRCYPAKYLVSLAAKYAIGRELLPGEFNGGHETNAFLHSLGFDIEGTVIPSHHQARPVQRRSSETGLHHSERCQECKATVLGLLRSLYGAVEVQKRFEISSTPEGFTDSEYLPQLREIFVALQQERGFRDFVRTATLPACDYFVPDPGFVVEFDESQHFTPLRKLALSRYPLSVALGFDRKKWIDLCCRIEASDNDPRYRDEQRAWYDTLRDFLPAGLGLRPTVRLYAGEYPWCKLNSNSPKDVETFRQIFSQRAHVWTIEVLPAQNPTYGRIVMEGAWSGDLNAARHLLGDVAMALPPNYRLTCLCTCGAFLRFDWPLELPDHGNWNPGGEIGVLTAAAERAVRSVLTEDLIIRLQGHYDYLTLGVDTKKDKISTTHNIINQPHAELVCLVNLCDGTTHWTGKFYPTAQQERSIVRFPDLQSHFVNLNGDTVMVLGCHDLTVYSPRGQARAIGRRMQVGEEFRALARQERPAAVLHHPHTTVKCGTWRQQWSRLQDELSSVRQYLGTGAYSYQDDGWDHRNDLARVIAATQHGDIFNIVVRLGVVERR
jgi:hypothetical protein